MNYTLKDLKHLDVMADLINSKPVEPKTIDVAKIVVASKVTEMNASEKILALCAKLRADGFDKHAAGLEDKFLQYKISSTHLYRAIDEDGEDLINAAHPDGEKEMADASEDLGVVETGLTQHDKIVDKITKEPTGKLASYLNQVKSVLHKEAFLVHLAVWIWSKTNRINQGIEANADILLSEIGDIETSEEIKRSKEGTVLLDTVKNNLNNLKKYTTTYREIIDPQEKDLSFIKNYGAFIVDVMEPSLKKLYKSMTTIRNHDEATIAPKFYRTFIASDFEDVQKAIGGLYKALLEMTTAVKEAKDDYAKSQKDNKNHDAGSSVLDSYDPNADEENTSATTREGVTEVNHRLAGFDTEMTRLNSWKESLKAKNMNDSNKQHINSWLDGQIKELSAATNVQQVQSIKVENDDFASKGIL